MGHDPGVDLHVDHAALRAAAAGVEELLPVLCAPGLDPSELAALATLPGGVGVVAEHDRLLAAVARTRRALAELADGLGAAAAAVAAAEQEAVRSVLAVGR